MMIRKHENTDAAQMARMFGFFAIVHAASADTDHGRCLNSMAKLEGLHADLEQLQSLIVEAQRESLEWCFPSVGRHANVNAELSGGQRSRHDLGHAAADGNLLQRNGEVQVAGLSSRNRQILNVPSTSVHTSNEPRNHSLDWIRQMKPAAGASSRQPGGK
jgi:hypothetical protein